MKKIRAEPGKHRLDNGFMKWSQETIKANKKTGHGITDKKETCPNTPTHKNCFHSEILRKCWTFQSKKQSSKLKKRNQSC